MMLVSMRGASHGRQAARCRLPKEQPAVTESPRRNTLRRHPIAPPRIHEPSECNPDAQAMLAGP